MTVNMDSQTVSQGKIVLGQAQGEDTESLVSSLWVILL